MEQGKSSEKAENPTSKKLFLTFKKIKNYTLHIGVAVTTVGSCFIVLPYFFLKDSPQILDDKTGDLFRETYQGLLRGQFFLIGILLLVIGVFLIRQYRRRNQY